MPKSYTLNSLFDHLQLAAVHIPAGSHLDTKWTGSHYETTTLAAPAKVTIMMKDRIDFDRLIKKALKNKSGLARFGPFIFKRSGPVKKQTTRS